MSAQIDKGNKIRGACWLLPTRLIQPASKNVNDPSAGSPMEQLCREANKTLESHPQSFQRGPTIS
jgi:hypothetical protein